MNEKQYLVSILLKARETISQVAEKAAKSLDNVVKAEDRSTDASKRATAEMARQRGALQQLLEARIREKKGLDDLATASRRHAESMGRTAAAYRARAREISASADALRKERDESVKLQVEHLNEARTLNELASATELQMGKATKQVASLRRQAAAHRQMADENRRLSRSYDISISAIEKRSKSVDKDAVVTEKAVIAANKLATAHQRSASIVARSISSVVSQINKLEHGSETTQKSVTRLGRTLSRLGFDSSNAARNLRGLNSELSGFMLAATIKYAQSLISAMTALAAQLFAVAAAAGQAAVGVGAALTSGMAQAIPVAAVLGAALARLGDILKAVKLRNQEQLTASRDAQTAARAQRAAAESIRSAEERLQDAHRNSIRTEQDLTRTRSDAAREQIRAQREVTQARKEAIRTVEDLIRAEEGASQNVEQARSSLRSAVRGGDVAGAASAEFGVREAQTGLQRAQQDAAPVRRSGVEGVQAVRDAEQRLADVRIDNARQVAAAERQVADAHRQENRASADLNRTRHTAVENLKDETANANKLADSLKRLTPAERELYERILVLQAVYRRIARPITDIVTRAFTDVVDRVIGLLRDPRIAKGFRSIAVEIAKSIRQVTGEAGGENSIGTFQILTDEATRNLPIVTEILVNFFRTFSNIVVAAVPAFRLLLDYVKDYSERARDASENTSGLSDFFITGVKYAKAFFDLGLAVVELFLALAGDGGAAASGIDTVDKLTGIIDGLTDKVRGSSGSVQDFFKKTQDAFFDLLSILGTLGETIVSVFSSDAVSSFADFLNLIIIPAIGNVVKIMGALVTVFHEFLSLPGVSQVAEIAATFVILAKGLTIIRVAVAEITGIIPAFLRAMGLMEAGTAVGFAALTPAGWVVIAIAAVIALIVLLDRKFHFLGATFKWIKGVADEVFQWLKEAATNTFDWVIEAASDVADWFSDVWNHGLLKWLRYPFVKFFEWLKDIGVFDAVADMFRPVVEFFTGDSGTWSLIKKAISAPFRAGWAALKTFFHVISGGIQIFLDIIAGRFDGIGKKISGIWDALFAGMYETSAAMINAMIAGLNLAIKAFNALAPGPNIPTIGFHMVESFEAKKTLDAAKAGKTKDTFGPRPTATGGYFPAAPGGRILQVSEAGHDEVVLTTDPKHASRQRELLGQFLERAPHLMRRLATGGWTQGAIPTPSGKPITDLAHALFRRGFNVTDALRPGGSTYHGSGDALDFGDSVNNLRALWSILYPQRGKFVELFGPTYLRGGGLYHGTQKFLDPDLQADHQDHIHVAQVAGLIKRLAGGVVNALGQVIKLPKILAQSAARTLGGRPTAANAGIAAGPLSALFGSGVNIIRDLREKAGATADGAVSMPLGRGPAGRKIFDYFKARGFTDNQAAAWVGNFMQESGLDPAAIQRGGPGRGLAQWGGGRFSALVAFARQRKTPWTNMQTQLDFVWRELQGSESGAYRGIKAATTLEAAVNAIGRLYERFGIAGDRLGPAQAAYKAYADRAKGGRFAAGGAVPGYGGGDNWPIWAEGGEHVWSKDEVARAGGHGAMYAMRRMVGAGGSSPGGGYRRGGPAKGATAPRSVSNAADNVSMWLKIALAPAIEVVNQLFEDIAGTLEDVSRKALRKSKKLALRIERAFTKLTEDGGTLDQIRASVDRISERVTARLQARQFILGPDGPQRAAIGGAELAQANFQGLRATRSGLESEKGAIEGGIAGANRAIREAVRRKDKKAEAVARAALANLQKRLEDNSTALSQNAQDQVEAVESFQEALLSQVNNQADRYSGALDRWQRTARALGISIDPNRVIELQIGNMRSQIVGLEGVLGQALRTGNIDLAQRTRDQIEELRVSIVEAVAQQFQNSIDAVNNEAARKTAKIDRAARRSQAGGVINYRALEETLQQRREVMTTQRSGLQALMNQAAASGNVEQFDALADAIDELDTAIIENTFAIRDNTDAAFNARTQEINDRFGFSSSVFGSAQGFFQAITERTGISTIPQQLSALQGIASSLAAQQGGLLGQLGKLVGADLSGLRGTDLVNYLLSIATGPAFDAIMATLDPTQQAAFKELVGALLSNAIAVEQNTDAIGDLTGNNAQSFSSSFWTAFRTAVFNGAGGLLPRYQTLIPGADVGARVLTSGALMTHAGETVRPATVSRDWGRDGGGDTYNLEVTTPTQVLNPVDVNRQLAFLRKTTGR